MIGRYTPIFAYLEPLCTFFDMTRTLDKDWKFLCMLNHMKVLGCSSKFIQMKSKRRVSNTWQVWVIQTLRYNHEIFLDYFIIWLDYIQLRGYTYMQCVTCVDFFPKHHSEMDSMNWLAVKEGKKPSGNLKCSAALNHAAWHLHLLGILRSAGSLSEM